MQGGEKSSLEQIQGLLEASQEVRFTGHSREEIYEWVGKTLREHDYARQGREAKGVLRSYVAKMTGQRERQEAGGLTRNGLRNQRRFPAAEQSPSSKTQCFYREKAEVNGSRPFGSIHFVY